MEDRGSDPRGRIGRWLSRVTRRGRREPREPLVEFVVAGAQKAGTTALYRYLDAHPQLIFGEEKELHFFDNEDLFGPTGPDWRRYEDRFPARARQPDVVAGEITPIYLYWPPCPRRIATYNPQMKVIAVLRDPRDRAWSQYHMEIARDNEDLPFVEAITREVARVVRDGSPHRIRSYLTRGLYAQQLERLWQHVPREQTLLVRYERLEERPGEVVAEICAFLGVQEHPGVHPERVFVGDYPEMPATLRATITAFFEKDVLDLERLTGWQLDAWKS